MIITGERIQELCDVYLGYPEDFKYNPRIWSQQDKLMDIHHITSSWDNPPILFCYTHRLDSFKRILQFIQRKFILVTHNSDANITDAFIDILNSPLLLFWHAQNVMYDHVKLGLLPIGIANSMWPHGATESVLLTRNKCIPKINNFYFYFNVHTNYTQRFDCKTKIERKGLSFGHNAANFESYLHDLSTYRYAICPPGNGIDSHRIWECFYLNVIPIVLRSVFTEKLSKQFTCILLDDWDDFNPSVLIQTYIPPSYTNLSITDISLAVNTV